MRTGLVRLGGRKIGGGLGIDSDCGRCYRQYVRNVIIMQLRGKIGGGAGRAEEHEGQCRPRTTRQDCSPESSADGAEPTAALGVLVAGGLDMVMTERETLTPESLITMAMFLFSIV